MEHQNGIALIHGITVVQFLSYEGSFMANDGIATGLTSTDIGVFEPSNSNVGTSMQLTGCGTTYDDFGWMAGLTATPDSINEQQSITVAVDRIEEIQGDGPASPIVGTFVCVVAVATNIIHDGHTIQHSEPDPTFTNSSSGIFVSVATGNPKPNAGELVQVAGTVSERYGETKLDNDSSFTVLEEAGVVALPSPVMIELPVTSFDEMEKLEGMIVTFATPPDNSLVVSETFELDRYGQFRACSAPDIYGRLYEYTQLYPPDVGGYAEYFDLADRSCIMIDDDSNAQNPVPILIGGLYEIGTEESLRGGARIITLEGSLRFGFNEYRISPLVEDNLIFDGRNLGRDEAATPLVLPICEKDEVRIVSANLMNFFISLDDKTSY